MVSSAMASTVDLKYLSNGNELSPVEADQKEINEPMSALSLEYESRIRPFLDLIDSLRVLGLDKDLKLPSIAVIGDQSSGKSSTLEAISGIQLPRGPGIMTRCPLELKMKRYRGLDEGYWKGKISYKDTLNEEHSHLIVDPDSVGGLVEKAQKEMTVGYKNISNSLITLEIEGKHLPDLTLIDLPGIARVAVGDQSPNICHEIRSLLKEYVGREETIILAVCPCNVDLATTEALEMARTCDPESERTMGVLTKPDLIDVGAEFNVLKILKNEVIELRKGYTLVKCRGQKSLDEGLSLAQSLENETEFFKTHDIFRNLSEDMWGINTLSRKLTDELVTKIKASLPEIKNSCIMQTTDTIKKLKALGNDPPSTDGAKIVVGLQIVNQFCSAFKDVINGNYNLQIEKMVQDEGMAQDEEMAQGEEMALNLVKKQKQKYDYNRLFAMIREDFEKFHEEIQSFTPGRTDAKLKRKLETLIKDYRGRELSCFLNSGVFNILMNDLIKNIQPSALKCLNAAHEKIKRFTELTSEHYFGIYPELCRKQKKLIHQCLRDKVLECRNDIELLLEKEKVFFSQDKNYVQLIEKARAEDNEEDIRRGKRSIKDTKLQSAEDMLLYMESYYKVVVMRFGDYIPATIILFLMEKLSKNFEETLNSQIINRDMYELLAEQAEVTNKRKYLKKKLEKLEQAEMILSEY